MKKKKNNLLVGITIDKFKGINPSALLVVIKKLGLEFIEVTHSVFDDLTYFKENLGDIQTGFHLPYVHDDGYDFSSKDHQAEIDQLIELINEHHEDLNINYCLTHPPETKEFISAPEESKKVLFENLKKLAPPVLVENIQGWKSDKFQAFFAEAKDVLKDKLLGQCFDAPHFLLTGENPVDFISRADGNMKCIHLSDCLENTDAHMPFGLGGQLPIEDILKTLKRKKYEGIINLELLPRTSEQVKQLIYSYLKVVGTFDRKKYYNSKFRLIVYSSYLKKTLRNAF